MSEAILAEAHAQWIRTWHGTILEQKDPHEIFTKRVSLDHTADFFTQRTSKFVQQLMGADCRRFLIYAERISSGSTRP